MFGEITTFAGRLCEMYVALQGDMDIKKAQSQLFANNAYTRISETG